MVGKITLSLGTRATLLSLQKTDKDIRITQHRLATGREVNNAIDDATAFFTSRNLQTRAEDLGTLKDSMNTASRTIDSALHGFDSMEKILKQMKAVASNAKQVFDPLTIANLEKQYIELGKQLDELAEDSSYNGINLLKSDPAALPSDGKGDNLTVIFNESTNSATVSSLLIPGVTNEDYKVISVSGDTVFVSPPVWTTGTTINEPKVDDSISFVDKALVAVRAEATRLGTNAAIISVREEFTAELMNTLEGGATDLVIADINKESANMTTLQTRQKLGVISLSIAQQSQQEVLRLF